MGGRKGEAKHELPSTLLSRVSDLLRPACKDEPGPSVGSVFTVLTLLVSGPSVICLHMVQ